MRDLVLPLLDVGVVELLHPAALQAHEVVVVLALVELEHRLAGFEVVADEEAGLLELGEHAIDGREADVEAFGQQQLVDVLGGQVPDLRRLEEVDDLEARQRGLEAGALQILGEVMVTWAARGKSYNSAVARGPRGPRNLCRRAPPPLAERVHPIGHASATTSNHPRPTRRQAGRGGRARHRRGCAQTTTQPFENFIPIVTQFGVYKLDINQGNYISQDMVDKLKIGQTKPQVRAALGTPLVTSAFRDNRWDYVYLFKSGGRVREHRQFTVFFNKDDTLARWEGDEMPQSIQELNRIAATRAMPEDPYGQDAGLIGKVLDFFRDIWNPSAPPVK